MRPGGVLLRRAKPARARVRVADRGQAFSHLHTALRVREYRDESITVSRRELHETCGEVFVSEPQDASLWSSSPISFPPASVSQAGSVVPTRAARIIARMPALIGSDRPGHASMTDANWGSIGPFRAPSAPDSAPSASESAVFSDEFAVGSSPVSPT